MMIGMQIHMASLNRLFYSYTWTRKNNQSDSKLPEIFIVEQLNSSSFPFGRPLNGTVFSGTQFFGSNISFELQISLEHMELSNPREKQFSLVHVHCRTVNFASFCIALRVFYALLKGVKYVQQGQTQNSKSNST